MAEDENPIIAYLGPEGSYTHQATLSAFKDQPTTLAPQLSIEDIFASVQSHTAYRGVVPFENSSNGSVVFTLDLFADLQSKYPDILVCDEAYVAVRHCLLGYNSSSSSSSSNDERKEEEEDFSHIKTLYSHPQAWGQCTQFLSKHFKGTERRDVASTSKAAELVAGDQSRSSAALSSVITASLFHLHVLASDVNDVLGNTTRFLVIRNAATTSTPTPTPTTILSRSPGSNYEGGERDYKSLVTFTVDHENPGALAHCLAVFEKFGLNLTSINTRPSGVRNWNYIFFVEFKGRREEEDDDDDDDDGKKGDVNRALGELDAVCRGWRWLGSWENRLEGESVDE